ncbi:MAG: MFS transporter [Bacteroidota bacterium]|nr:MFS transporter [Bacteroidota bacterium]
MEKQINRTFSSIPVFLAFLCMGFGDVVGPLTGLVKEEFQLSNVLAQMIPFMGFMMFGLLSIPMGIFQDKKGKKFVLMFGLILAFLGLILPILGNFSAFYLLLIAILLLGAGATMLQVAGNPIMRDVSPEGKYARNLSLGQFIKAIGSLSGALIPLAAANYWGMDWKILFPVYSAAILITMLWMGMSRIKEKKTEDARAATFKSCLSLLGNKKVFMMVLAIFLYVGAEVSMSSGLPIYLKDAFGYDIARLGLLGTLFFFIALMTGRFLGALILNWISATRFLIITLILSIMGFVGLFIGIQAVSIASIFVIGLGFANIFPLIFSITVDAMPERTNELSGLMVTAIVGGAIIPPIMGAVADYSSTLIGFIIPLACILYIAIIALNLKRKPL